ncbi:MAG: peptidyl-alpha-hydroxyglycine alpha-amidating lyase family protein [Candidatus Bathyarchaeota archaeon]|nr:peptidyl-alpha-hydroxyglycine alpha-amidating lyase family protein [Candidatus Bathyarchaeota archaeon]
MEIWERIDSPSDEVLEAQAGSTEELLNVRAWEVEESPTPLGYTVVKGWPKLPDGWMLGQVAGVATDSKGRYYVFHRGEGAPPLICFDRAGEVIRSWGVGVFVRPHMVKCDGDDNIWAIDDNGHVLYLYSPEGEVLRTLGTKGAPGEDGSHFDKPTDIAYGREGGFYVSDGYGNKRVARFNKGLNFQGQWGSEGVEPGQFVLPHAITTDEEERVYVADRNRWRVQIFSPEGKQLKMWTHIGKPFGIVYASDGYLYICDGTNARVTKVETSGKIVGFFGTPSDNAGQISTAHDISVAPNGDILLGHLDGRAQLFSLD